ncbi:MAG TPA: hypothetical protein VM925_18705 [Labilithrix sp.]|jgi:hypothetical protein|nr:hypothetical protein [Labilithrix sp.]
MGARVIVLGACVCVGATALVVQACGSTEDVQQPVADSGPDVIDSGEPDVVKVEQKDSATCDLSADFTTKIPDAAIADGASTSGLCLACTNAKCKEQVDACNQNCRCQEVADEALTCYLQNTANPYVCGAQVGGAGADDETRTIAINLIVCVNSSCTKECATEEYTGPKDAGAGADADAN